MCAAATCVVHCQLQPFLQPDLSGFCHNDDENGKGAGLIELRYRRATVNRATRRRRHDYLVLAAVVVAVKP
jgi:hypothetical protein